MINLNQNNSHSTTPVLRSGFRVFFMAAGLIATISMVLWGVFFHTSLLTSHINTATWHAHEMIFAYTMAVIVGFLLTAVKNWTGVQTLHGKSLLALFMLWALARFLPFIADEYLLIQAFIDVGFLLFSLIAIAYPIIKTRQWKHSGIIAKLLLMLVAHSLFYFGLLSEVEQGVTWGLYLGFYLILSLIFMMIRRLIPFFIERGLGLNYELKNAKFLDVSSLVLMVIYIPIEVFFNTFISVIIAVFLVVIHGVRLVYWYNAKIWTKPLIWGLYLAYGLLILGFGFKVASYFVILPPHLDVHSFAFGIALITISMMSRVSLGHTGRDVFNPPKALNFIFILLILSFIVRVFLPILSMDYYTLWIFIAQVLWVGVFATFSFVYIPMFFKVRIDGQSG
ncbi:MAG: NnrS family protein [Gammaproteobacteria bacterium]|nr:MAG: NnrS family protein [Gammaproteobacteria bacterium]